MLTKSPPIVSGVSINDKLVPSHFDSFLSTSVGVFFVSSEKHSSIIGSFKYKCKKRSIFTSKLCQRHIEDIFKDIQDLGSFEIDLYLYDNISH